MMIFYVCSVTVSSLSDGLKMYEEAYLFSFETNKKYLIKVDKQKKMWLDTIEYFT